MVMDPILGTVIHYIDLIFIEIKNHTGQSHYLDLVSANCSSSLGLLLTKAAQIICGYLERLWVSCSSKWIGCLVVNGVRRNNLLSSRISR